MEITLTYADFLEKKQRAHSPSGFVVESVNPILFDFQKAVVKWSLERGRSCIFAGTGLGKTMMQIEWAKHVGGRVLVIAPLAVSGQTIREAEFLGVQAIRAESGADVGSTGVYITNYDRLHLFENIIFDGVVLDESSILKSHDGAYRKYIQDRFSRTPYKLPCTATPSPNDYMELGTHAELVGAMTRPEMLATYFVHDGGDTSKWRLKKHAVADFWKWVSTWACVFSHPRDIGFEHSGYELPQLHFHDHIVEVESTITGGLFGDSKVSATHVFKVLRESAADRVKAVAELVASQPDEPWIIWCNTDAEQKLIEQALPGIVSVKGSDSAAHKESSLLGFADGKFKTIVTKPSIAGFGLNWQRCARMCFCGVTYSFEQLYQSVRRCWRFGQTRQVHVYLVTCNAQESIKSSLRAKDEAFMSMSREMSKYCSMEMKNYAN